MGVVLKTVLFLLRRGPGIYETGKLLARTIAESPALTAGRDDPDGVGGGRIEAIERELRLLNEDRDRLSADFGRLSKEVAELALAVDRAGRAARVMAWLFVAFVGAGLLLAAVILSRFP